MNVTALLAELRRRSVYRVAGAYAVVGWLLVQAAGAFESGLGLPGWFDTVVIGFLAVGLPVALVIAWAFELTPDGIKRSAPAAAPADAPVRGVSPVDVGFLVALVAVLAATVYQIAARPAPGELAAAPPSAAVAAADPASIAVLPFLDMSPAGDQAYFSDGLSEELLNALAQLEDLRVISRTSSFAFRGRDVDVREVGDALGVRHVLEGSVRKDADRLRIVAQLIDASDGSHVWSKTYDRRLDDVFAVQEDIARIVAGELQVTLGVGGPAEDFAGTESFEAYDHYLKGIANLAQGEVDGWAQGAEEFRTAAQIDPDFAKAWIGLARMLSLQGNVRPDRMAELQPERVEATRRALELAPDAPNALVQQAWLHIDRREWLDAYRACERVFAGPPNLEAIGLCAGLLTEIGAVRAALPYREAWLRSNPLSMTTSITVSRQYVLLGMRDEFLIEAERAQGLQGDPVGHESWRLLMLLGEGAPPATVGEALERFCVPNASTRLDCPTYRTALDAPAEARPQLRARLDELRTAGDPNEAMVLAWFAAYFDEDALALDALEFFGPRGAGAYYQTVWAPVFADVRPRPKFKQLMIDDHFVEVWRATGDWGDYCRPLGDDDFECV